MRSITQIPSIIAISIFYILFFTTQIQPKAINLNLQSRFPEIIQDIKIIPTIVPKPNIYEYQGTLKIDIQNGEKAEIDFFISFTRTTDQCILKQCFIGWVTKYIVNDLETVQGYPNAEGVQPIFRFQTSSEKNFTISFSDSLGQAWKQIINIACEKFNPLDLTDKGKTRLLSALQNSFLGINSLNLKTLTNDQDVSISNLKTKQAKLSQSALFTNENLISKRGDKFAINLETERNINQKSDNTEEIPELKGLVNVELGLTQQRAEKTGEINKIQGLLKDQSKTIRAKAKLQIQSDRLKLNSPLFDTNFKDIDSEPQIELIGSNPVADQNLIDGNFQKEFSEAVLSGNQFQVLKGNDQTIQKQLIDQNILLKGQKENLNSKSLSVANIGINNRQLQTGSYNVLNYNKVLYSKTVFGKTIQLEVKAICNVVFVSGSGSLSCSSNLVYTIFGNVKNLAIFSFVRPFNIAWSWGNTYGGVWSFHFAVPLPPPVSFITINFYVGIRYYISLSLSAKLISAVPYKYQMRAVVETGIDTDARASLRAIVIEGGVFIRGTLVKVGTDPTVTLTFLFAVKKIYVNIDWYFWIIGFLFEWGFFWRYWTFWSGWSSVKIIAKWNIYGLYAKYPVVVKSFYINM